MTRHLDGPDPLNPGTRVNVAVGRPHSGADAMTDTSALLSALDGAMTTPEARPVTCETCRWLPITDTNLSSMFGKSQWGLIATNTGRVTEAVPYNHDGLWFWVTGRGFNCADPRYPTDYLTEHATHWMPLPAPPGEHTPLPGADHE